MQIDLGPDRQDNVTSLNRVVYLRLRPAGGAPRIGGPGPLRLPSSSVEYEDLPIGAGGALPLSNASVRERSRQRVKSPWSKSVRNQLGRSELTSHGFPLIRLPGSSDVHTSSDKLACRKKSVRLRAGSVRLRDTPPRCSPLPPPRHPLYFLKFFAPRYDGCRPAYRLSRGASAKPVVFGPARHLVPPLIRPCRWPLRVDLTSRLATQARLRAGEARRVDPT